MIYCFFCIVSSGIMLMDIVWQCCSVEAGCGEW